MDVRPAIRALAGGAVLVGLLAGCTGSGTAPGASGTTPATATPPAVQGTTPPAPPSSDPRVLAAWEALMSPDGEYAAAAAYAAVIEAYGPVEPYVSIHAAEQRHSAALTRQLQRLGVTVPANPYLGTVTAPASLAAAAKAWADGEVRNVAMYDRLLAAVDSDPALTRVFGNLQRASEDVHLPLFRAAAEAGGTLTREQVTGSR